VAWSALAALLFFVVKTWFGFEIPGWDQFISLVIAAGVAFGIFNNPTNKTGY
jgi:TM2 domain-containing membrane protein YozV